LGIIHVPDIDHSPQGIPFFGAIAESAAIHGKHDIQCYINCDILIGKNFIEAVQNIRHEKYLIIGQRINLAEGVSFNVTDPDYLIRLKMLARAGKAFLHPSSGSDYFVFRRGMWEGLQPVVIGRGGYDNALINHCLRKSIPVIDASFDIKIFHPVHDYNHIQGGKTEVFGGSEAKKNIGSLATAYIPTLIDADWIIKNGRLKRNYCRGDRLRSFWSSRFIRGRKNFFSFLAYLLWICLRTMGLRGRSQLSLEKLLDETTD